jgi:DNA-binding transcriptional LysR family regulator
MLFMLMLLAGLRLCDRRPPHRDDHGFNLVRELSPEKHQNTLSVSTDGWQRNVAMDGLRAITIFVRAAEAGSFQRVAVDMGLSPQAVSKAVSQLEAHLRVRLFHRTTRSNSLTAEGLLFLESVQPGLEATLAALARVRSMTDAIEGPIRITAAHAATKVLARPVAEFNAQHPGVQFEMLMSDAYTDIVAEKIDVGFRSGPAPSGQLIVRRLFPVQQIVCAAPAYLALHGAPHNLGELARHRCTVFRHVETGRLLPWELMVDGELRRIDMAPSYCTNDPQAELDAVLAGIGIGLIDSINATAELRAGRLVPLLAQHRSENLGFFVYYAQRTSMPRRVRAFIDFIVQRLQGSKEFLLDANEFAPRARRRSARAPDR